MRVFVTGASGFVGRNVVRELTRRNHEVVTLVHRKPVESAGVQSVSGGLFDDQGLADGMRGCDAVVHIVGIIMEKPSAGVTFERMHVEGTRNVLAAATAAGVRRYVHMSALGSRADAVSRYHQTKWAAEEAVRASGLEWTIFRPSLIHGPDGEFMLQAAAWAKGKAAPWLFMPYFGAGRFGAGGAGLLQPVFIDDVARAFVDALDKRKTAGQAYDLAGPDRLTWPELHRAVSTAVRGRAKRAIPIPAWYARAVAAVTPGSLLPFNRDQVIMSQEDNTADITPFVNAFGFTPAKFAPTLEAYKMKLA